MVYFEFDRASAIKSSHLWILHLTCEMLLISQSMQVVVATSPKDPDARICLPPMEGDVLQMKFFAPAAILTSIHMSGNVRQHKPKNLCYDMFGLH